MVLFSLCPEGLTCLLVAETSQTVQRVFIKTLAAAWVQAAACELKCCNVSVPFPPDCARDEMVSAGDMSESSSRSLQTAFREQLPPPPHAVS